MQQVTLRVTVHRTGSPTEQYLVHDDTLVWALRSAAMGLDEDDETITKVDIERLVQDPPEPEPNYDAVPFMETYHAAWESKNGPDGTHKR